LRRSNANTVPSSDRFKALKALIREAAREVPDIGPLEESMKWGQPSFAPAKANIGSSVRIEARAGGDHALMFICTTGLVEEFRTLYTGSLTFEGNRAIVIPAEDLPDPDALKHCIQLALTHKLRKRAPKGRHPRA
jgi:hypothetical protein